MNYPCANTIALNQYLNQLDKVDQREHAIATRTIEILASDEYAANKDNIAEAVAESMYGKNADVLVNAITRCMGPQIIDKDALSCSMVIAGAVKSYWYEAAKRQAESEIDNEQPGAEEADHRYDEMRDARLCRDAA